MVKGTGMADMGHATVTWGQAVVLVLILAAGVGLEAGRQGEAAEPRDKVTADDIKKESKEALEATKEYTAQQKDAFYKKAQAELDEMQAKIVRLKAEAGKASGKVKADVEKMIHELEEQKEAAAKKLEALQSASGRAWNDLKAGMNSAMDDLKKSYQRARSRLN